MLRYPVHVSFCSYFSPSEKRRLEVLLEIWVELPRPDPALRLALLPDAQLAQGLARGLVHVAVLGRGPRSHNGLKKREIIVQMQRR